MTFHPRSWISMKVRVAGGEGISCGKGPTCRVSLLLWLLGLLWCRRLYSLRGPRVSSLPYRTQRDSGSKRSLHPSSVAVRVSRVINDPPFLSNP